MTPNELEKYPKAIAIIGMAGRFPGAKNIEEYQSNLKNGIESITFFSDEELLAKGVKKEHINDPRYVKASPMLEDACMFDADFFGYSTREAEIMDPQQRVLLECSWEALENAGYAGISPQKSVGVFVGGGNNMGSYLLSDSHINKALIGQTGTRVHICNDKDYLGTRISYELNLHGPSFTVQTACSTALVATHLACQSLNQNECDIALAGAVTVRFPQYAGYWFQEGGMYSPDGHCRTFDAKAQGMLLGSGVGIIVLKKLSEAIADKDNIEAIILGSSIRNDGARKHSYWAPSVLGQSENMTLAFKAAGISPETIGYIETHGTATPLGDPVEMAALTKAFQTTKKHFCAVGSVKTNIGHTESVSGVAGIIKSVLSLKNKKFYPILHYSQPNPKIDFENSPFYVSTEYKDWPEKTWPRRAAVNALGVGGTNGYVILQEAPQKVSQKLDNDRDYHLLNISAKTPKALNELKQNYIKYLETTEETFANICYTANCGRVHFEQRIAVVANSPKEAVELLSQAQISAIKEERPDIAFLFTGQGAQYPEMARDLYETQPLFRKTIDLCDQILSQYLTPSLLAILYPSQSKSDLPNDDINKTNYTQPALFALEYALAKVWQSWGVMPSAVMGHSIGEYTAACIAGVFSLEDGLKLVAARGRLMQNLPTNGAMLTVFSDKATVLNAIRAFAENVSIAAINGSDNIVISGLTSSIENIENDLHTKNIQTQRLTVSHAFHSPLMKEMIEEFSDVLAEITFSPPKVDLISNVTGTLINEEICGADYWVQHVLQPVLFFPSIQYLEQMGYKYYLEIGPKQTLSNLAKRSLGNSNHLYLSSLRFGQPSWHQMLNSLSKLYLLGVKIDWFGFDKDYQRERVVLPTYPFQRSFYQIEPKEESSPLTNSIKESNSEVKDLSKWGLNLINHPFLKSQVELLDDKYLFLGEISLRDMPWLADHKIHDTVVVPATAYIDFVWKALETLNFCSITELIIINPMILTESISIRLEIDTIKNNFTVYSREQREQNWKKNAEGKLGIDDNKHLKHEDRFLWPSNGQELVIKDFYSKLAERGFHYGNAFRGLTRACAYNNEWFGKIRLAKGQIQSNFCLHPILLDSALHLILLANMDSPNVAIPFELYDIVLWSKKAEELYVKLTVENANMCLELYDEDGQPVAKISNLVLRKVSHSQIKTSMPSIMNIYQLDWETIAGKKNQVLQNTAIVGNGEISQILGIPSFANIEEFLNNLDSKVIPKNLILDFTKEDKQSNPAVAAIEKTKSVLKQIQILLNQELLAKSNWIWITQNTIPNPEDNGQVQLDNASISGLLRSAKNEYPRISIRWINIDSNPNKSLLIDALAEDLEPEIIVHNGKLLAPRLNLLDKQIFNPVELTGTVLITGGTGALGSLIAKHLVSKYKVKDLLLLSRQGATNTLKLVSELEQQGANVQIEACDIADYQSLSNLLANLHSPLQAVIHASGVLDDGMILNQNEQRLEKVMQPKMLGAWNLHQITKDMDLKFFVLFSSISGVVGSSGQSNYCAANAFLDQLAMYRQQLGLPAQSLAWGLWHQQGMANLLSEAELARLKKAGIEAITTQEGLKMFDQVLMQPQAFLVPTKLNTDILSHSQPAAKIWENLLKQDIQSSLSPSKKLSLKQELITTPQEKRFEVLQAVVLSEMASILSLPVSAISQKQSIGELRFDSLMTLELRNSLSDKLQFNFPLSLVTNFPSLQKMTHKLLELLNLPDKGENSLDLTNEQRSIYLGTTQYQENYNSLFCLLKISGMAEKQTIETTLNIIFPKYISLFCSDIKIIDNKAQQVIYRDQPLKIQLCFFDNPISDSQIQEEIQNEIANKEDFQTRVFIYKGMDCYYLNIIANHIFFDLQTVLLFYKNFCTALEEVLVSQSTKVWEYDDSFEKYIEEEQKILNSPAWHNYYQQTKSRWLSSDKDLPVKGDLEVKTELYHFEKTVDKRGNIQNISDLLNIPEPFILMVLFQLHMHVHFQKDYLIFLIPVFNRNSKQLKSPGCFMKEVFIESDIHPNMRMGLFIEQMFNNNKLLLQNGFPSNTIIAHEVIKEKGITIDKTPLEIIFNTFSLEDSFIHQIDTPAGSVTLESKGSLKDTESDCHCNILQTREKAYHIIWSCKSSIMEKSKFERLCLSYIDKLQTLNVEIADLELGEFLRQISF